ncbi:7-carboxy-7-deazaguanine synthase QueE [Brevibacillus laterosporus]|uniref:7-carboxy-7-deazaguanine synthase QueE n=1 Tax=Brevibacillus laterosporus TaxID=1465 RepID=UPI000C773F2F|nr:7-carboxy-7-deazaguanine synthase QueE [Brevibacillus laterosporus]AUM64502.1 7-carboxy-7-deazaguanine synthase QueE [Brevibacillus laterosporus]
MIRENRIPVMEIFGPTIQGEGMVIGCKTVFIRTGGCDYSCAWCDSAFTWNGEEKAKMMTSRQVFEKLHKIGENNFNHVTISGGNPALIGEPLAELINLLHQKGIHVGLETQGTRFQEWFYQVDNLIISPKPPSSNMVTDFNKLDDIVEKLTKARTTFSLKVVVFDDTDFNFAKMVHLRYIKIPFYLSVGNPKPYTERSVALDLLKRLEWLFDKVIQDSEMNNVRPLPQLHTLVWGNKRKV